MPFRISGQGALESAPPSTPHFTKTPERQRTAKGSHRGKRQQPSEELQNAEQIQNGDESPKISGEELRRQLGHELDDIQQLRESLNVNTELKDADLGVSTE